MYKCFDEEIGKKVAKDLLAIHAIKLQPSNPFQWASGWKSPIYCDNRLSLSFPALRTEIKLLLVAAIKATYPTVEAIAGVATAGIPQGALIAEEMGLPFIYVRSKSKGHGLSNQIEGHVVPNQKVVVIEDLVSTGGSSLAAVEALTASKITVLGMACIFTYGFGIAEEKFKMANVDLIYLSEYQLLIQQAIEDGQIDGSLLNTLNSWRNDPANWG